MQIVSIGDNLHGMSKPVSRKDKKNIFNLLSAELAQRVVMFKLKPAELSYRKIGFDISVRR